METADERKARLAAALRANLKRRKAQARELASPVPPTPNAGDEPPRQP